MATDLTVKFNTQAVVNALGGPIALTDGYASLAQHVYVYSIYLSEVLAVQSYVFPIERAKEEDSR